MALASMASMMACAGKVRYPSYYVLDLPAAPAAQQHRPTLGPAAVRQFRAPEYLRSGPIVYRPSPQQLAFYDYHRWASDPRTAVTTALIGKMQARGLFESVSIFDGRGNPDYLLSGTLDRMEEVDRGDDVLVEVSVSAQLTDLRSGAVLWHDVASQSARLDERTITGIVAEMSRSLDGAVEHLTTSLERRLSAPSSASNQVR